MSGCDEGLQKRAKCFSGGVTLQSSDFIGFQIPREAAQLSETIRLLMLDSTSSYIPLPGIKGQVLGKVVEFFLHHYQNLDYVATPSPKDPLSAWDQAFVGDLGYAKLIQLANASNYLDARGLTHVVCSTISRLIKGKTPAQIRANLLNA